MLVDEVGDVRRRQCALHTVHKLALLRARSQGAKEGTELVRKGGGHVANYMIDV